MILAGDIGGTKTNLALAQVVEGKVNILAEATFPSKDYAKFEDILQEFDEQHPHQPIEACFGIAGPVRHGVCHAVNLPWVIESESLQATFKLDQVRLINDLEATGYGVEVLEPNELITLNEGDPQAIGTAGVIAAGTGLGEGGLYWDGKRHLPFASEGGHSDFAPRDEIEIELFRWLKKQYGNVSTERVLSGPGLVNLYRFFYEQNPDAGCKEIFAQTAHGDPAPIISQAALAGKCPICVQALDRFVSVYGAAAGNLALKLMSTGGMYVGGGIAPKILEKMKDGTFLEQFFSKGRMRELMENIPIKVILSPKTALLGAAWCSHLHSTGRAG